MKKGRAYRVEKPIEITRDNKGNHKMIVIIIIIMIIKQKIIMIIII